MNEQPYAYSQNPEEFENERLGMLEGILDPMTISCLEMLGVTEGWNCLEVGAGRGSVAVWLARKVGFRGRVLATDLDTKFLRDLNIPTLDVRQYDILKDDLEEEKYDLVHCRALLLHLPQPEKALEKMARATKPGGWLFIEEPDYSSYGAVDPDYPSADLFNGMFRAGFEAVKKAGLADNFYGRRARSDIERLGFIEVGNQGYVILGRGGAEPYTRLNEMTVLAIACVPVISGLFTEEDFETVKLLFQDPGFYFLGPTVFGAWGKRP